MHFSFATGAYPGPRRVPIDVRALFYAVSAFDELSETVRRVLRSSPHELGCAVLTLV